MQGCSRLNSFAAPFGQSSVQDLLKIRLINARVNAQPNIIPVMTPFHGCHCNINASFRMRRRNEIQRVLKDYTKKYLGLPEQAVHLEAFAGTTAGTDLVAPKRLTADILFIVGAEKL